LTPSKTEGLPLSTTLADFLFLPPTLAVAFLLVIALFICGSRVPQY